jgi:acetamidase/formamidase
MNIRPLTFLLVSWFATPASAMPLQPPTEQPGKLAVREALRFLTEKLGMERAVAFAYLSAATDFNVSQVVDRTKGIHALIRKRDFSKVKKAALR